jgi:hypothetical protein
VLVDVALCAVVVEVRVVLREELAAEESDSKTGGLVIGGGGNSTDLTGGVGVGVELEGAEEDGWEYVEGVCSIGGKGRAVSWSAKDEWTSSGKGLNAVSDAGSVGERGGSGGGHGLRPDGFSFCA